MFAEVFIDIPQEVPEDSSCYSHVNLNPFWVDIEIYDLPSPPFAKRSNLPLCSALGMRSRTSLRISLPHKSTMVANVI